MVGVLVTGGSGFIGSWTIRELLKKGCEVVSYSRRGVPGDLTGKIVDIRGDITDFGNVVSVVKDYDVEYIFHTVSLLTDYSQRRPPVAFKVNGEGTLNVLEAARIVGVKRVVYTSGTSVYGRAPLPGEGRFIREGHPKNPVTIYGATKLLCEHYGYNYARDYGFEFIAIRYPIVFGPGKSRRGFHFFKDIIEGAMKKKHVKIERGGENVFEGLYIKDAVQGAVLALLKENLKHITFNIGTGTGKMYTLRDLVEVVKKFIPDSPPIEIGPGYVESEPIRGPLDITRAEKELGYKPKYALLEDSVKDYIETISKAVQL